MHPPNQPFFSKQKGEVAKHSQINVSLGVRMENQYTHTRTKKANIYLKDLDPLGNA